MSDSDNTYDNLDTAIREKITEGRERFNACTMRWVAFQLNVSPDVVRHRLQKMQNDGLVDWNDMAGSLIVLAVDPPEPEVASTEQTPATPPAATTSKKPAPAKKAAKKAAPAKSPRSAKKSAASSTPRKRTSRS